MSHESDIFLAKSLESLRGVESEFANGRFNKSANRAYYSCFQAAIATLLQEDLRPLGRGQQWGHAYVQAQFVNRRKHYPPEFRDTLARCLMLRLTADYQPDTVTEIRTLRAFQQARAFVEAVHARGGEKQ